MREGIGAEESHAAALPLPSSNPFLEGLLGSGGNSNNPFMPSSGNALGGSGDFSSSLLSSLLSGSNNGNGGGNPLGIMGDLLSPPPTNPKGGKSRLRKKKGGGMDTLAKSVLSSLLKRIEDEETQVTICNYLQSTNVRQVMQFSSMAGVPMTEQNAGRLVSFANGVTPKGISKSISKVRQGITVVNTLRQIWKVIDKYKPVIVLVI